jgi:hypothetical protein
LEAIIRCCGKKKCSKVSQKVRTTPQNRSKETAEKNSQITESLVLPTQGFSVATKDTSTSKADELSAATSAMLLG